MRLLTRTRGCNILLQHARPVREWRACESSPNPGRRSHTARCGLSCFGLHCICTNWNFNSETHPHCVCVCVCALCHRHPRDEGESWGAFGTRFANCWPVRRIHCSRRETVRAIRMALSCRLAQYLLGQISREDACQNPQAKRRCTPTTLRYMTATRQLAPMEAILTPWCGWQVRQSSPEGGEGPEDR